MAALSGMALLSSNQLPRSISLQRSLQNGRQRCSVVQTTSTWQVGHFTIGVLPVEFAIDACVQMTQQANLNSTS